MARNIRRVVTGHDDAGNAVVLFDGAGTNVKPIPEAIVNVTELWVAKSVPADNGGRTDAAKGEVPLAPPSGGAVFRVVEFLPEKERPKGVDQAAMARAIGADPHHVGEGNVPRHASMHKTRSIDFAVVISGEIDLLLDKEEVHLAQGDVLVQRGTNHGWINRTDKPCLVAFVLADAKPVG